MPNTEIERTACTVDIKRVIAQVLIAQRMLSRGHSPQCVSVERIQETLKDLRKKLSNGSHEFYINASREAIERTVFFNSMVLDMNEDAGLVYFRNNEPSNSDIHDEYYLSDKVKSIINSFTNRTIYTVF